MHNLPESANQRVVTRVTVFGRSHLRVPNRVRFWYRGPCSSHLQRRTTSTLCTRRVVNRISRISAQKGKHACRESTAHLLESVEVQVRRPADQQLELFGDEHSESSPAAHLLLHRASCGSAFHSRISSHRRCFFMIFRGCEDVFNVGSCGNAHMILALVI
jgi:hypothetical protein